MAKLTKRIVDMAEAGDKVTVAWDDELRGFGLRVYPNGRKVYIVKCRIKGQQRFITLGQHGPVTADQARAKAYNILSEAKNGRDPARELDQMRKSPTMKDLGERFLKEHVAVRCKPSTQGEYKRSVELFINPKLGTRKVCDIDPSKAPSPRYSGTRSWPPSRSCPQTSSAGSGRSGPRCTPTLC